MERAINRLITSLDSIPKVSLEIASFSALFLIGYIDYLAGIEISLTPVYLPFIVILTWFVSPSRGVIAAILSTALTYAGDCAGGLTFSHHAILFWSIFVRFIFFLVVVILLDYLKKTDKRRRLAEENLQKAKERLEMAQAAAGVGAWVRDLATGHMEWTPQMYTLLGLDPGEAQLSLEALQNVVHPEDREAFKSKMDQALKEHVPLSNEFRVIWPDGSIRWLYGLGKAIYDDEGRPVRITGICLDVTRLKEASERIKSLLTEKELLLKEVHHRIKNNMSTMMGLLSLQAKRLKEPSAIEALNEAKSRLKSMGVMYEKLYCTENYGEVSIRHFLPLLIKEIFALFPHEGKVTIETKVDDFMLSAKTLSPLGLIVNELITNAMKYAFTGKENGVIKVSATAEETRAVILFEDDGVGIPESVDLGKSSGFGLSLVSMLAEQLEGTIRIERQEGTRFILEFKR